MYNGLLIPLLSIHPLIFGSLHETTTPSDAMKLCVAKFTTKVSPDKNVAVVRRRVGVMYPLGLFMYEFLDEDGCGS